VLFGCLVAALVLQTLALFRLNDRTQDLRTDVCHIAAVAHITIVHCASEP